MAHRRVITVFKREAQHGEDPDVKSYAANEIPTLEKELKQAEASLKPAGRRR